MGKFLRNVCLKVEWKDDTSANVCRLICVEVNLLEASDFDIACCLYILLRHNAVSCRG